MENDLWRWADPDGQQRRVRKDELRAALSSGLIPPNAPVWRAGFANWVPARDVPELTSSVPGVPAAPNAGVLAIPPPPMAVLAVQHAYESASHGAGGGPPTGQPEPAGEEPPPPPAYVPLPAKPAPASEQALPPSFPTTIGLPPPPELAAAVAQAKAAQAGAKGASARPPAPPARPRAAAPIAEEMSSSSLIEVSEPRLALGLSAQPGSDGLPLPTDPIVAPPPAAVGDAPEGEPPGALASLVGQMRAIRAGQKPKNPLLVPVVGLLGGATVILVVAGVVSLFRSGDPPTVATSSGAASGAAASAPASASAPATSEPGANAAPGSPAPVAKAAQQPPRGTAFAACSVTSQARVVAAKALIAGGLEVATVGNDFALGFSPLPREGGGVVLGAGTLSALHTLKAHAAGDVRRVSPVLSASGKPVLVVDGEKKVDAIASRRVVGTSPLLDVGVAEGNLVWAPRGKDAWAKLFALEGSGPVEALRAVPLEGGKGVALAFRRDGILWVGSAAGDAVLEPRGALARIAPRGQVGSPSIAATGNDLVVAWAERGTPEEAWKIRLARASGTSAPAEAITFDLPAGGLGEQAMSPHVAALGGGRVLLSWTEGPATGHQTRAVVLDDQGKPSGAVLEISPPGTNAGQSQAAVSADGRGVAAFLGAKGKGYEVYATGVTCTGSTGRTGQ